jgi:hypothetical protein
MEEAKNYPTMIIPSGTEVRVNDSGQLSIRTPGNLVIQNSGVYSVIESGSGSVRIDPEVKVEAVSIQAANSCFVAGELTAWRVRAHTITLEKGAKANIMLQESESLELDRDARLVGNFASEKELYLMLGRFSRQLRELPQNLNRADREQIDGSSRKAPPLASQDATNRASKIHSDEPFDTGAGREKEDVLSLVRVILERELGRPTAVGASKNALERMLDSVRSNDHTRLKDDYQYLFSQVENPSDELEKARQMLARLFG